MTVEIRKYMGSSGIGVSDPCDLPCGCWELDLGHLEEQPVRLAVEPSLQPWPQTFYALVACVELSVLLSLPADATGISL